MAYTTQCYANMYSVYLEREKSDVCAGRAMAARFLTGRLGFDSLVVPVVQEPELDPLGLEMKVN